MNSNPSCIILGAGGHGRVVLDILKQAGLYPVAGFVDSNVELVGRRIDGVPVLGTPDDLPEIRRQTRICHAIVAVGDNGARRALADQLETLGFVLINAIHPSANIARNATIGRNVVVAAGALVCAHCQVGDSVILNTGCIVDHESMIGTATHICPGARLAGRVTIESGAFIGIGATIIQSLRVGYESKVGAGAVVIENVDPMTTVIGVPAKPVQVRAKTNTESKRHTEVGVPMRISRVEQTIPTFATRQNPRSIMFATDRLAHDLEDQEVMKTAMTGGTYPHRDIPTVSDPTPVSVTTGKLGINSQEDLRVAPTMDLSPSAENTPVPAYIGAVPFDR
ncbi:MAG: acetyltransferase [Phycisphaerae bacterium]